MWRPRKLDREVTCMENVIPRPRDFIVLVLRTFVGVVMLALAALMAPDHNVVIVELTTLTATFAAVFRLDASTSRDFLTLKRILVVGLSSAWSLALSSAGVSLAVGHNQGAFGLAVLSLPIVLLIGQVLRSAPEQWLGANWRERLKAQPSGHAD